MDLGKLFQGYATNETDELVTVTAVSDSSGSLAGTYFNFYAKDFYATMHRFVPYMIVGGVGQDPTQGYQEVDSITVAADSSGNTASKYVKIYDGTSASEQNYYVYFLVNNSGTITGYDPRLGSPANSTVLPTADTSG